MGELINLDTRRKEKWIRTIEQHREMGTVAVFGNIGEVDATILPFRRDNETPEEATE